MIFKHKKENFAAYQTLKNIASTIDFSLFRNYLERSLVGIDVLFKNLALFAYKLENYDEVIKISMNFIQELKLILSGRKELDKLKLKTQINCPYLYEDFIEQKKSVLSYFYYLLAKCQDKNKDEDAAMENIKNAVDVINDKNHEYHKKYNKFYQHLMSKAALKHSIEINYEDFKRNLLESQNPKEINNKNNELSFNIEEINNNSNTLFKKIKDDNLLKKPNSTRSLHKILLVSETFAKNQDFFEKKKLFNQSLHNCSTTVRNASSLRSKASSFHQKFETLRVPFQKPMVKFIDLKSLLIERPKSAVCRSKSVKTQLLLNKKSKEKSFESKEKSNKKEKSQESKDKKSERSEKTKEARSEKKFSFDDPLLKQKEKTLKSIIKDLIRPNNTEASENGPISTQFQKEAQKILTKAFSTRFNLQRGHSKSNIGINSDKTRSRRFSERPNLSIIAKKAESSKTHISQHIRYSSAGPNITISSAGKSPKISPKLSPKPSPKLPGRRVSSNDSLSNSSDDDPKSMTIEEKKERIESRKSIHPTKLATISNSDDETPTPKNQVPNIEKKNDEEVFKEAQQNNQKDQIEEQNENPIINKTKTKSKIELKFDFKFPFVKVIFSYVLLKKKKKKLESKIFGELQKLPMGEFFGAQFEAVREKLHYIMMGYHSPFWFFCKPPGNCEIYYWLASKVTLDLRKGDNYSDNQIQDIAWNIKGIEIRLRVFLENSRARGPFFILEIQEKLDDLLPELLKINEYKEECFYRFVNVVLAKFLDKWKVEDIEIENNLQSKNDFGSHDPTFKFETFKKYERRRTSVVAPNLLIEDNNNEEIYIDNMQDKISYILSNLVKLKRKINGFAWTLRKDPLSVQEEKNMEILAEKTRKYARKEIFRIVTLRKPLGIFVPKQKRATGFLNVFNKKQTMEVSEDYFRRNSLLKALQRNTQNSLLLRSSRYQIKESRIGVNLMNKFIVNESKEMKKIVNIVEKPKQSQQKGLIKFLNIVNKDLGSPRRNTIESRNKDQKLLRDISKNQNVLDDKNPELIMSKEEIPEKKESVELKQETLTIPGNEREENGGLQEFSIPIPEKKQNFATFINESMPIPKEILYPKTNNVSPFLNIELSLKESIPRILNMQKSLPEVPSVDESLNENEIKQEILNYKRKSSEISKSKENLNEIAATYESNLKNTVKETQMESNGIFPEKPVNAEENVPIFFLNSFNEKFES